MGINHWCRVDIINWYIFRHDILLMTILKGLLWFNLKPIVEMDQVKSETFIRPWIYLNQIGQRWTTDDKWTEFGSNVPSPTNRSAFIAEFVAMEALRGVFRGVFRGVCNRLLFCWAFLRRQNMEMKNKGNLGTCACGFFGNQAKVYSTWMNQKHIFLLGEGKQHGNDSGCNAIYYVQLVIICIYVNRYRLIPRMSNT